MRTTANLAVSVAVVVTVLCSLAPTASQAADHELLSVVTSDADIAVRVQSVPTLIEGWRGSPISQLWNDQQVQQFFAPLRRDLEIDRWNEMAKEETGYELGELLAMMTGELVLFLPDLVERIVGDEPEPAVVLLAEVGDNQERLRELLMREIERAEEEASEDEEARWVIEEHRDIEIHLERSYSNDDEPRDELAWAFVDDVLVVSLPGELLRPVINDHLDGGSATPLTSTAAFQSVSHYSEGYDLVVFANAVNMVPAALQALAEEEQAAQATGEPIPSAVFSAMGLDTWLGGFLSANLDDSTSAVDLGLTFTEPNGLMQMLAYGPGEAPRPEIIPPGALAFTVATFDIQAAWAGFRGVMEAVYPGGLETAAAQITATTQQSGVELDLRRDLLGSFGNELVMVQVIAEADNPGEDDLPAEPEELLAVSIKQRQGIELTLETIKGMAGQGSELFEEREFLDTTIYTLKVPQDASGQGMAPSLGYAVTDRYLLVSLGGPSALEAVLIAMRKPDASIWQHADLNKALAVLPLGAAGVGYQDMARAGNYLFATLAFLSSIGEEEGLCDQSATPDSEVIGRYIGPLVTGIYRDSSSLVLRMRLLPSPTDGQ